MDICSRLFEKLLQCWHFMKQRNGHSLDFNFQSAKRLLRFPGTELRLGKTFKLNEYKSVVFCSQFSLKLSANLQLSWKMKCVWCGSREVLFSFPGCSTLYSIDFFILDSYCARRSPNKIPLLLSYRIQRLRQAMSNKIVGDLSETSPGTKSLLHLHKDNAPQVCRFIFAYYHIQIYEKPNIGLLYCPMARPSM